MGDQDIERIVRQMGRAPLNRRSFLKAGSLSASAAFLAACSGGGGGTSAAPSAAASAAASAPAGSGEPSAAPAPSFATEGALFMYNWAEYIDLENIEEFKTRYNISDWTYDIYDSNEVLLTKMQGGATGLYDIGAPTARVREGHG